MSTPATRPGLRPPTRPGWEAAPDLLRTIWIQPRATVRWLLDHGTPQLGVLIVSAASASAAVGDGGFFDADPTLGRWAGVVEIVWGIAIGLVAWWAAAAVLTGFGKALGGVGAMRELRVAVAYGQVPAAASLPFAILRAWSHSLDNTGGELIAAACMLVLGLWSLGLIVFATAEAHRFSFARAALCGLALCGLYGLLGAALHLWLGGESV
jgi:hypothetical protein